MEKLYNDIDILWKDLGKFELALSDLQNTINSIESSGLHESFSNSLTEIAQELKEQIDFLRDLIDEFESNNNSEDDDKSV